MKKLLLPIAIFAVLNPFQLSAATMIADGTNLNATTAGTPGGPGLDGYEFFGMVYAPNNPTNGTPFGVGNLVNLPGYANFTPAPGTGTLTLNNVNGAGLANSTLTVSGTAYQSGDLFFNGPGADAPNTPYLLGTITLQNSVPSAFRLGLLLNNYVGSSPGTPPAPPFNITNIVLTLSSAAGTVTFTPDIETLPTNDFYFALITGASIGDTITITGINANKQPVIGGITFDAAAIPEPSSLALALLGAGMVYFRSRRRH